MTPGKQQGPDPLPSDPAPRDQPQGTPRLTTEGDNTGQIGRKVAPTEHEAYVSRVIAEARGRIAAYCHAVVLEDDVEARMCDAGFDNALQILRTRSHAGERLVSALRMERLFAGSLVVALTSPPPVGVFPQAPTELDDTMRSYQRYRAEVTSLDPAVGRPVWPQ